MARSVTVEDDVADAIEAAAGTNENGEKNFAAGASIAGILGGGLLSMIPMVLQLLTAILPLLGNTKVTALLKALPQVLSAINSGNWEAAIQLLVQALGVPAPTPAKLGSFAAPPTS